MATENVVKLNTETDYVYQDILTFLDSRKSKNTRANYEIAIRDFFIYMRNGKTLDQFTKDDLKFRYSEVVGYQQHLKKKKNPRTKKPLSNKSINAKIQSVKSLFRFLKKDEEYDFIRLESFDVEKLDEYDDNTHGFFDSYGEAMLVVEAAKNLTNGEMKSVFYDLAIHTSLRIETLLQAKPYMFSKLKDKDIWIFKVKNSKSKVIAEKEISKRLWERIEKYIEDNSIKKYDYIFHISSRQIGHVDMQKIVKMLGIEEERNIKFHSLRKVAALYEIDENNDIVAAQDALGHKSPTTVLDYYYKRKKDHERATGITIEQEEDMSNLEGLGEDELLKLIHMCCNKKTIREMNCMAEKIAKKDEVGDVGDMSKDVG